MDNQNNEAGQLKDAFEKAFENMARETNPYQSALSALAVATHEIEMALSAPEHAQVKISVLNQLQRAAFTLANVAGIQNTLTGHNPAAETFGPVTSFFGDKIEEQRKPIDANILFPARSEKDEFLRRRDELYESFPTTDPSAILKIANEPKGEALIRSVGKKSGLPESIYRDHQLNTDLIATILATMKGKKKIEETVESADNAADLLAENAAKNTEEGETNNTRKRKKSE